MHVNDVEHPLDRLVTRLEADSSLDEPEQLRARMDALDALDAAFASNDDQDANLDAVSGSDDAALARRATALRDKLEAANAAFYESVRLEIQREGRSAALRESLEKLANRGENGCPLPGLGYEHQDELVSGVLALGEPGNTKTAIEPEMVFYQPTPVRHILRLIAVTGLSPADVLVDLGSGLGHVPLLAAILAGARSYGIEIEPAYVACAVQCARSLGVNRIAFHQQDARTADLSIGTVFHLYTPFTGVMLAQVLERLRAESANRQIKITTLGPCAPMAAAEPWLQPLTPPDTNQITLFQSRS